jgi:hypothetical protein
MNSVEAKWNIHENLLQWYRSIFIASQSFFLVVGALFLERSKWIFPIIAILSVIVIWWIWFRVVISRHKIVDYYKHALELDEERRKQLCTEKEYVNSKAKRREANQILGIDGNWRTTRKKMDLYLPILFSFIWLLMSIQWICDVKKCGAG